MSYNAKHGYTARQQRAIGWLANTATLRAQPSVFPAVTFLNERDELVTYQMGDVLALYDHGCEEEERMRKQRLAQLRRPQ